MPTTPAIAHESDTADHALQLSFGTEFEAEAGAVSLNRKEASVAVNEAGAQYTIRSLYLTNFKGFTRFEVNLGRFNVLVGGNNSGKSTILRAVRLAYELTKLHFHKHKGDCAEFYAGRSVPKSLLPVAQLRDLWPAGRMREGNKWIPSRLAIQLDSGHRLAFGIGAFLNQ